MPSKEGELERCKGCQSFCMNGKQSVFSDTNENTSWSNWDSITKDVSIINDYLTATSQKDLAEFIKKAYEKGDLVNANNYGTWRSSEEGQKQLGRTNGTYNYNVDYNFFSSDYNNATESVASGNVIKASHYNAFVKLLTQANKNGVSSDDAKSSQISISGNTTPGPVIGSQNSTPTLAIGMDSVKDKTTATIITAEKYKKLGEQAKKLLYHPYQCNICNVYESPYGDMAVEWAKKKIANKATYSQANRNGPNSYDCSSFCFHAYGDAGAEVPGAGLPGFPGDGQAAGSTENMHSFFTSNGFSVVSDSNAQPMPGDVWFYTKAQGAAAGKSDGHAMLATGEGMQSAEAMGTKWGCTYGTLRTAGGAIEILRYGDGDSWKPGDSTNCHQSAIDNNTNCGNDETNEGGGNSGGNGGNSGGNGGNSGGCTNGESCYTSCQAIQGTISPCQAVCQIYNSPYDTDCDSRQLDACGQR